MLTGGYSLLFALIVSVNVIYQVQVAHLNPLQFVLVGTVLEATAFLCQVPTGVLADVYSRRLAIIAGLVLMGVGFALERSVPRFGVILLAQVVWGIGVTFMDGAEQAWITDELGEARVGIAFLRGGQVGQVTGVAGTIIGVAVANATRINIPILLGGGLLIVLGIVMFGIMPESGFRRGAVEGHPSWREIGETTRSGLVVVRQRPILLNILFIAAVFGMFSEGFDRLSTAHFLEDITLPTIGTLKPVVWFGMLSIGSVPLQLIASEIMRRRLDMSSHTAVARTLLAINMLLIVSICGFALAGNFPLAVAMLWSVGVSRNAHAPLYTAWLNQHIDSRVRATLISVSGQADALGQIAGGPLVGTIGLFASLRVALAVSGLILLPALPLFARTLRLKPPRVEVAELRADAEQPTEEVGVRQ
ncbi:MAG: MFS transporter [Ktedonobacterales bacterium]